MVNYERVPSDWDHMNPGMGLAPGQRISSSLLTESAGSLGLAYKHIKHTLTYQHDGNLVLYRITSFGAPDVGGAPGFDVLIDKLLEAATSGDLVDGKLPDGSVGDDIIEAVWATGTNGRTAGAAVMQPDGNFVVYDGGDQPVWASGTGPQYAADYIWLRVQRDGNLVLYKGHAPGQDEDEWVPVWATGTNMPD
ncbi:hypothetical protein [Streptomyces sp. NPDC051286]|uniref:hypothetical protein n=1 Tax=Streptomyces sp. NPDC051286 TaxID=3365647 RepID=UPI003796C3C2